MKKILFLCFAFSSTLSFAQPATTSKSVVQNALMKKKQMEESSIVKNIAFTNIGPTVMGGRVVDIDVNPANPVEFYVGYATGGLWYTNNNGTTFTPVMDSSPTQNIGDIAVDWKNGTLWVGTGENNSSRSSYAGIGILKSTDKGKTWQNMGLLDSHHIGRIILNPTNPNVVVVGSIGHLYSANEERGIYKTTDGGKTWKQTLFINEDTGIIDIAVAPNNSNIMYAASWERERKAWNFVGSGKHSAIYKSTDGGDTWQNISGNGFPVGNGVGRIGLAVYDENTVYALHDSQFEFEVEKSKNSNTDKIALYNEIFKNTTGKEFVDLDDKQIDTYLKSYGFHEKYRANNIKNFIKSNVLTPGEIPDFLQNSQALPVYAVTGAEVYLSTNGGRNWEKKNKEKISIYSSYGYYFGEIRVDPQDKNGIYILGISLLKSKDGGETFTSISRENVHSDHQAFWVNPNRSGHIINGNDGGVNMSYDDGESWSILNHSPVGQFYTVFADNQKPYNVYGGMQDNGVWYGPSNASLNKRWESTGQNPYKSIMGGDGMQVQVDSRDHNIVYTGFQFGNYYRLNLANGKRTSITPKNKEKPLRYNWQTPILLSPHNQDILYFGSNKLHRSLNNGDDWEAISSDLTLGEKKGNVAYGTLTTISESPFQFGLIYVGSDDGLIQLTKNGGGSWQNISTSLPKNLWVSRVVASKHKKERVYATLNGYRWDNFTAYVYMSDDYGVSWEKISGNIPDAAVNVIKEDPENPNIIYLGTDNGLYISFNNGNDWSSFSGGLPNVAMHDLVIQPETKDLIVGTHGRSIYKTNIATLQQVTPIILAKNLHLFKVEDIQHSQGWGNARYGRSNTPGVDINFYADKNDSFKARILTMNNIEVSSVTINGEKGFNVLSYDVAFSKKGKSNFIKKNKVKLIQAKNKKTYLPKGMYKIELSGNGTKASTNFEIK